MNVIPQKYRPLVTGDCAYLMGVRPETVKKRARRGTFCPPAFANDHNGQRIWLYGEFSRWARDNGIALRPLADLDTPAEAAGGQP